MFPTPSLAFLSFSSPHPPDMVKLTPVMLSLCVLLQLSKSLFFENSAAMAGGAPLTSNSRATWSYWRTSVAR